MDNFPFLINSVNFWYVSLMFVGFVGVMFLGTKLLPGNTKSCLDTLFKS